MSLGALIITFLVYAILPMFHNLHGHIVRMNIISMVFFNVSLLVVFHATQHVSEVVCMVVGLFTYFSSIAMFSWMTGHHHLHKHHEINVINTCSSHVF